MPDHTYVKEGDRITYTDGSIAVSGSVFEIMESIDGEACVAVIECDDGKWAVLDLRDAEIRPMREALN